MKWFHCSARGESFPNERGDGVSGTVQSHGGSEGAAQHPGGFPGGAGRRLRRQADDCPERQCARGLPGAEVEGARGQDRRAAAARSRPADVPAPLPLRRQGRRARSAGAHPDPAELSRARRPREGRRDRQHDDVLRGLGQRAVGALPARQASGRSTISARGWRRRASRDGAGGGSAPPGAGGRSDVPLAPPTRGLGGGRDDRHGWTR